MLSDHALSVTVNTAAVCILLQVNAGRLLETQLAWLPAGTAVCSVTLVLDGNRQHQQPRALLITRCQAGRPTMLMQVPLPEAQSGVQVMTTEAGVLRTLRCVVAVHVCIVLAELINCALQRVAGIRCTHVSGQA